MRFPASIATSRTPEVTVSPGPTMYESAPSLRMATAVGPLTMPFNWKRSVTLGCAGAPALGGAPSAFGDSGGTGGSGGLVLCAPPPCVASGENGSGRPPLAGGGVDTGAVIAVVALGPAPLRAAGLPGGAAAAVVAPVDAEAEIASPVDAVPGSLGA